MYSCPWSYFLEFSARRALVCPHRPYQTDYVGKLDALIGSEKTYAPPAGVGISRRRPVAGARHRNRG
jgi:hypothetical protein